MYGVSPCIIGFLMGIVTLLSPFASYHTEFFSFGIFILPGLYAPIWIWFYSWPPGLYVLNPTFTFGSLVLAIPNLFFLAWIIRYYQGKTTRYNAISVGAVSVVFPLIVALSTLNLELLTVFNGPVPIQFIIGLIVLYRIEGPELRTPWEGQLQRQNWWERPRHKYPSPEPDSTSEEELEDEDDWLEE